MKNTSFKKIVKVLFTVISFKIIGVALSYYFIYLISKNFGSVGMGIFALTFTLLQMASIVGRCGIDISAVKLIAEDKENGKYDSVIVIYKTSLLLMLLVSLFLAIALFLSAPVLAKKVFNKSNMTLPIQIVSLGILPTTLRFLNAEVLRGLERVVPYAFLQNTSVFLFANMAFLFLFYRAVNNMFPIYILVLSQFITFLLSSLIVFIELKLYLKFENFWELGYAKRILRLSIPLLLASSFNFLIGWTDTLMLGIFRTEEEVGIYNVAIKLALVMLFSLNAIGSILMPKVAALWARKDYEGIKKISKFAILVILVFNLVPLFLFIVFPGVILSVFGNEFEKGKLVLVILGLAYFINSAFGVLDIVMQMTAYQVLYSRILIFTFLLNVLFNYIFVPSYGIVGAAVATAISLFILRIMVFVAFMVKIGTNYGEMNDIRGKRKGDV